MNQSKVLIQGGTLVNPGQSNDGASMDILVVDGNIVRIAVEAERPSDALIIDAQGCFITPGLFDLRCQLKDPGKEHKEDVYSASAAAVWSGFTGLLAQPATEPVIQNKSGVWYLRNKSSEVLPDIHVCGAATSDLLGRELTEMYDMHLAGALAFSNGDHPYPDSNVLMLALQYGQSFGALLMSHAEDHQLASNGSVNESAQTIHTGLKKRPGIAESIQVQKEIELIRYTGGRLHFSHISTAESVDLIRRARQSGLQISCDVSIWNLLFTDEIVDNFNPAYKCLPPLRTPTDRDALINGLRDGTIDAVVSDHNPHNIERKNVEFEYAAFGNTSLQTFYSAILQVMHKYGFGHDHLVRWASINPRRILGLPLLTLSEGAKANLAVLHPELPWTLDGRSNRSKSLNNPFFNRELNGCSIFTQNGTHYSRPLIPET